MALTCASYGTGSIRNRTSPAFSGTLAATGTSITSPATSGTIATELRATTADPCGAPQPIGMNNPISRSRNTMAGEIFQNRLKWTIFNLTSRKRMTR